MYNPRNSNTTLFVSSNKKEFVNKSLPIRRCKDEVLGRIGFGAKKRQKVLVIQQVKDLSTENSQKRLKTIDPKLSSIYMKTNGRNSVAYKTLKEKLCLNVRRKVQLKNHLNFGVILSKNQSKLCLPNSSAISTEIPKKPYHILNKKAPPVNFLRHILTPNDKLRIKKQHNKCCIDFQPKDLQIKDTVKLNSKKYLKARPNKKPYNKSFLERKISKKDNLRNIIRCILDPIALPIVSDHSAQELYKDFRMSSFDEYKNPIKLKSLSSGKKVYMDKRFFNLSAAYFS